MIRAEHELSVATAPNRRSRNWRRGVITWGEFLGWVANPADKKESGNYLFGELSGMRRGRHTIVSRSALTLDADTPETTLPELVELVLGSASVVHTTFSSTPENPRYRVVVPLSRPVLPDEYAALADLVMDDLGVAQFDLGSREPARYMFKPSAQERQWYQSWVYEGEALDVDEMLKRWDRDLSHVSVSRNRFKRDPFQLEGVVGAFNRAYANLETLVKEYELPYEAMEHRWHLVGAVAEAGMSEIAPGLYYSHHISDPAYGQTCTAFDLVRLHRFVDEDADAKEGTPVNRLPSYKAMAELASRDSRVTAELVGVAFDDLLDDIAENPDSTEHDDDHNSERWKLDLVHSPNGRLRDIVRNWDLICRHDPVFRSLCFNEMTQGIVAEHDLPWRPLSRGGETFTTVDRQALLQYLEREYNLRVSQSTVDARVNTTADQRHVNPVREYLESLEWDGEPRLDTCLPGARITPYTRLVARKSLVAAVARVLHPGIKWDHTLVLFGREGIGKTHWIERMSRDWCASLGRIGDKDTILAMQHNWIMVSDEGVSLSKADSETMKEFLTRTEDSVRMPYDRETVRRPRRCVIWGSTNDEVFLRREEGNRRFLIVHCEDSYNFEHLTDDYIDQVWAEAVHRYREGERLWLNEDESALCAAYRERFVEEDSLAKLVANHLNTLVPAEWAKMSPNSRLNWLHSYEMDMGENGVEHITRICSSELYVELLGHSWGTARRRSELLELSRVLNRLPGWKRLPGEQHVPHYGQQVVFERMEDDPDDIL